MFTTKKNLLHVSLGNLQTHERAMLIPNFLTNFLRIATKKYNCAANSNHQSSLNLSNAMTKETLYQPQNEAYTIQAYPDQKITLNIN